MRASLCFLLLLLTVNCSDSIEAPEYSFVIENDAIPLPLTPTPGNAERGRLVFVSRDEGHCVLCHVVPEPDIEFQGNVGPDLTYASERLSAGQLRLRIADASLLNSNTVMPPYYRTSDLNQVGTAYRDKTVLSAQDIEDIIAYLLSLKTEDI